jgi:hypothetical protein
MEAGDPFLGSWFCQCSTCFRYFFTDAKCTAEAVAAVRETHDSESIFCSVPCMLAAPIDPDDWPSHVAPCWGLVTYAPSPPRTVGERVAQAKRRLLAELRRRQADTSRPAPVRQMIGATTATVATTIDDAVIAALTASATPLTAKEVVAITGRRRSVVDALVRPSRVAGSLQSGAAVRGRPRRYRIADAE